MSVHAMSASLRKSSPLAANHTNQLDDLLVKVSHAIDDLIVTSCSCARLHIQGRSHSSDTQSQATNVLFAAFCTSKI